MKDFMFEIVTEDSELCGEQFFVECNNLHTAWEIATDTFINEELDYLGTFSRDEAEEIGLDTY